MPVEVSRYAAGGDHDADLGITCEFLQALSERVAHFGVEVHALRASQRDNGNSICDFRRQQIRVHRDLPPV
jgi:hypothetical protein